MPYLTSGNRLTPLDASFLDVESETAHMHVGWAALFAPPPDGSAPSFETLRDHIEGRLCQAPRYRQKLARVPLGFNAPVWVDDRDFDIDRHVLRAPSADWDSLVDMAMSAQLDRGRPLWEIWIADGLEDGRIGVVGKAHHCMVDGLAAVELAALLLDPTPQPRSTAIEGWRPEQGPSGLTLVAAGMLDRAGQGLEVARLPFELARRPKRLLGMIGAGREHDPRGRHSLRPATSDSAFNDPISPRRHLAPRAPAARRPARIKHRFDATVNDVVLAAASGGVRRFLDARRDAGPAQGDGAGEPARRQRQRPARQPDLVPVRRPPVRRARPRAAAA